jgi:hypothetical protein
MLVLVLGLSQAAGAASDSAETQKSQESKGITVEDLGRALKSAEQNIEREIPKIGPAIGETVKKIMGKDSKKQSSQGSEKEKK